MSRSGIEDFLSLDAQPLSRERAAARGRGVLFVSLNPDLTTDFGHFLNYERRLKECCDATGADYACFAHRDVCVELPGLEPVFPSDSGRYSMMRNGATGEWRAIVDEFWQCIQPALARLRQGRRHDRVVLFLYCGSSLLANRLSDLPWPPEVEIVVNAFWDFLLPAGVGYDHVARLSFQRNVRLLAMSELHAEEIFAATGLRFDSIPNPPPLLGDVQMQASLRGYGEIVGTPVRDELRVFVPGLMTLGKGRESTADLYRVLCDTPRPGLRFRFRDRTGMLGSSPSRSVDVLRGDLTDDQGRSRRARR